MSVAPGKSLRPSDFLFTNFFTVLLCGIGLRMLVDIPVNSHGGATVAGIFSRRVHRYFLELLVLNGDLQVLKYELLCLVEYDKCIAGFLSCAEENSYLEI